MHSHNLIVIGGGPGGYTAAIRAAQLGLDVACVDKNKALGGTCLRIGCIPSKALLESSELFEQANSGLGQHGIVAQDVRLDLPGMLRRKDAVVRSLTLGIAGLIRKNKIKRYQGTARFLSPSRLVVAGPGGTEEIGGKHIIIATGQQGSNPAGHRA